MELRINGHFQTSCHQLFLCPLPAPALSRPRQSRRAEAADDDHDGRRLLPALLQPGSDPVQLTSRPAGSRSGTTTTTTTSTTATTAAPLAAPPGSKDDDPLALNPRPYTRNPKPYCRISSLKSLSSLQAEQQQCAPALCCSSPGRSL